MAGRAPLRWAVMRTALLSCLLLAVAGVASAGGGRVAALSELRVNERVEGDVVVMGGDVVLGPQARVSGDVITFFGTVEAAPTAQVDGHVIAVGSLAEVRLLPMGAAGEPHLQLALRLLMMGGWLLVTSLIAFLAPGRVRFGTWLVGRTGFKSLVLGVLVAITLVAALVAAMALGPTIGLPLVVTLGAVLLAVKTLGLTVLGGVLGGRLLGTLRSRPLPLTVEVFVGVAVLLLARLVPVLGEALWTLTVIVSLGAAVFTLALVPEFSAARASRS